MKKLIVALMLVAASFGVSASSDWKVREAVKLRHSAVIAAEFFVLGYWSANEGTCMSDKRSRQLAEEAFTYVKYNGDPDEYYFAELYFTLLDMGMCRKEKEKAI